MAKLKKGLIQVFYGDGRGKTSAAMGTAARAAGHGLKVAVIQFLKGGGFTGEAAALKKLGVEFDQFGPSGPSEEHDEGIKEGSKRVTGKHFKYTEEDIKLERRGLQLASEKIAPGDYDLVVMDEVLTAVKFGHIDAEAVASVLYVKNPATEVILTGHYLPDEIKEMADLITEMKKIKHPFDEGVLARWGVDY